MKNKVLIFLTAFATLFLAGCATTNSTPSGDGSARLVATRGQTEIRKNGAWRPAKPGATLRQGDAIRTGTASDADLNFGEFGGTARVNPESEVWIQHFGWTNEPSGKTMLVILDLRAGRISGDTLNPAPNSRFMVKTAGGTFELK